jgi:hypothetical protein
MQDQTREVSVRKVVVSKFVSLDGVMEDPSWESPFRGEEQEKFTFAVLAAADALLLGTKTYVGSTTLQEQLGWNNSTIKNENIPEEVRQDEQRRYKRLRRGQRPEDVLRGPRDRQAAGPAPWRVRHQREPLRRAAAEAREDSQASSSATSIGPAYRTHSRLEQAVEE